MRHLRSPVLAGYLAIVLGLSPAFANPLGGNVVGGSATIQGQGTANTTINQTSDRTIINWNTFNIGAGETTRFNQPGASSIALNRVTGNLGASQIYGTLTANGRVFLVNPNGILFGGGAVIDTAGFLATTNDIKNDDFMAGRMNFTIPGNPSASIVNLGTITAHSGGIAALVAPGVRNAGTITADLGKVALASGNGFTLDFYGDKMITLQVGDAVAAQVIDVATGQPLNALVKNEGKLQANGGRVELSAVAARQVVDAVINNTGVIEANTVGTKNGMIVLGAATAATKGAGNSYAQNVKVSGRISAAGKNAGEKGGKVQITGENIALTGATIDASGKAGGGKVLIGGDVGGGAGNAAVAGVAQAALEGEAIATASTVTVDSATLIDVSATERGNGGKAVIWSDHLTSFAGAIHGRGGAQGGDGGFAEVSSKGQLSYTGFGDLRAPAGKFGTLLLDPHNLTISDSADAGTTTAGGQGQTSFTASSDDSVINKNTLLAALAAANVVVSTGDAQSPGNQAGNITVAAQLAWSQATTLTLVAASNITINAAITATKGGLTLDPGGAITTGVNGTVNVGTFTLQNGAWSQVGPSIPAFSASDFRIVAGSFLRALGGDGTSGSPYQIADAYGLQGIGSSAALLTKSYALANDIDASGTVGWNSGAGFKPIGSFVDIGNFVPLQSAAFTGSLNGQGHSINNLFIDRGSTQFVGLFSVVGAGGSIVDTSLTNVNIANASYHSGGMVGLLHTGATIAGSSVSGFVHGTAGAVGGMVGDLNGTVTDSHANVTVTGGIGPGGTYGGIGGLAYGVGSGGVLARSYATGNVTGAENVGGLVGVNIGTIIDSYATGTVQGGNFYTGGLVGGNWGTVANSYSTGAVAGLSSVGGLVGQNHGTVTHSYWNLETSGQSTSAAGTGLTSAQMRDKSSFVGWDFSDTGAWFMVDGHTRPLLKYASATVITSIEQLQAISLDLYGIYRLAGNLDATATAGWNYGAGFIPIGSANSPFQGWFDGGGKTISNLTINSTSQYVGLFGYIGSKGLVNDISLINAHVTSTYNGPGYAHVGALAGYNEGLIAKTFATGSVSSSSNSVGPNIGGLVGTNYGSIGQSHANVTVTGSGSGGQPWVGGLVGQNSGSISLSYAEGNVTGTTNAGTAGNIGGLVGYNSDGTITQSHALGNVTGNAASNVGGLVGHNTGTINDTYATGTVGNFVDSLAEGRVEGSYGGLVGRNADDATIADSWANGAVVTYGPSNGFIDAGGLVGTNIGNITGSYATGAVSGFSLSSDHIYVGGLVGLNDHGVIENSHATGAVTSNGYNGRAGGLVAVNDGGDIIDSYATGAVTMSGNAAYAGGLAGENKLGGLITQSYATGHVNVSGGGTAGGLVAYNDGSSTIDRSRAAGNVTVGAGGTAGGLVGWNDGEIIGNPALIVAIGPSSSVVSCVAGETCAGGTVTVGSNGIGGGLVGKNDGTIEHAYAKGTVFGAAGSVYGDDYDSATILGGLVGINYGLIDNVLAFGNAMGIEVNGVTAGGIVAGGLVGYNAAAITNAVAYGAARAGDYSVVGGLVGGNLIYSSPCVECQYSLLNEGWYGAATIINAAAFGGVRAGDYSYAGGAVGYVGGSGDGETPSLVGVSAYGNVRAGADSAVGGVAGRVDEFGSLFLVKGFGDVTATGANSDVGGVVGYNSGAIVGAEAWGRVVANGASSYVGGLAGANDGIIASGYAFGDVTGAGSDSYVGGLVGANAYLISHSGATGNVSSTAVGNRVGGLAGWNAAAGVLTDVHYVAADGKGVYGTSNSWIGGLVGVNDGSISNFTVDPPVVGSGSGNQVGGAVGNNAGTLENGDVIADVTGGNGSTVGPITGVNSGSVSGITFTGTVNGANPNGGNGGTGGAGGDGGHIQQIASRTDPGSVSNPNPIQLNLNQDDGQGGGTGGSGGAGGPGSGGNGGAGGAGNPPTGGPPPGPGLGRTTHEQRFSGVPPIGENRFVSNEVVVQVASSVSIERVREIARSLGMTLIASQAIDSAGRVVYRFSTGSGGDVRTIIRALERNNMVASAQPNYVFTLAQAAAAPVVSAPAVTAAPAEASLPADAPPPVGGDPADVTGALPPKPELSDADLQSDMAARTTLPAGDAAQYIIGKLKLGAVHTRAVGRNVTVAVIDSEIDTQHPDLQGVVAERFDATSGAPSPHAHGTGMAGAIASKHRLLGIAPGVRIFAIKAFDETAASAEATSFQILKGLDWAIAKKVRIINMSFAGPRDLMMERALQKATDQGIVLIAAAGNAGPKSPPLYPAADPNVIAVSATDYADKPFAMANRGKYIAVAAPGVDVLVPSPKGGYQLTTGTSVAAAHVSGVAALLLESRPKLTPKDVRAILTSTARAINLKGRDDVTGAGLVDPFQALSSLSARSVDAGPATQSAR